MDGTFVVDGVRKAYVIDGTPRDMMHRDCYTRVAQEVNAQTSAYDGLE
jgi:hypothetical protein